MSLRVLHIEDDVADAELVQSSLETAKLSPQIERIERKEQLDGVLRAVTLGQRQIDLILSDYKLPAFDGLTALDMVRARLPDMPFIMVTGSLGDEFAVDVIKRGASDFVVKENLRRLEEAVVRALREAEQRRVRHDGERRQRLLMRELDHRVKNNLAAVIALCEQMLPDAGSVQEFGSAFTGRLHNMARLQEALAQSRWEGASIRDLLMLTVGPLAGDGSQRLTLNVPERLLPPSAASTLSMILYELAVNAARHGAFSRSDGRVVIDWREEDGQATLTWTERVAGTALTAPTRIGRGTQLIRGFAGHELHGDVDFDYRPEGLVFTLRFPIGAPEPAPVTWA